MTSSEAQQRAERSFKQEERAQDGRKAVTEYEAEARAIREKTLRLKALRLAEEESQTQQPVRKGVSTPQREGTFRETRTENSFQKRATSFR